MRALFHVQDDERLVADPEMFDLDHLEKEYGSWGSQFLRNSIALEIMYQLIRRSDEPIVLKGGTLLQSRLQWPPVRASIDLDLETYDLPGLQNSVREVISDFQSSKIHVVEMNEDGPTPGAVIKLSFPGFGLPEPRILRIDALETQDAGDGKRPWIDHPPPWKTETQPLVPTLEEQATQKLLMHGDPPFGRDLGNHRGRQNRIKDLFDLACLGQQDLDSPAIMKAADEEVARKSAYMARHHDLLDLLGTGMDTLTDLAGPKGIGTEHRKALWRAYLKVRPTIRTDFLESHLRMSAGCTFCSLHHIENKTLDWIDAWTPYRTRGPRKKWHGKAVNETVLEVEDGFGPEKGVLEAWGVP